MFLKNNKTTQPRRKAMLIWTVLMALLMVACQVQDPAPIAEKDQNPLYQRTSKLIGPHELKANLATDPDLVILELSKEKDFKKGHLPDARNLWRSDYASDAYPFGGMADDPAGIAALLGSLGVSSTSHLVLYDASNNCNAARFWWILDQMGHSQVQLLDGGKQFWEAAGYELSAAPATHTPTTYTFPNPPRTDLMVNMDGMQRGGTEGWAVLLDTRSFDEYKGKSFKKGASRPGHIPGAIHLDYVDAIQGDLKHGYSLKSVEELETIFANKGLTKDKTIFTYCHSGARSAHTTFVLTEVLGYENVRNYDGSWTEWSYHPEMPAEKISNLEIIAGAYGGYATYFMNSILFKVSPWYQNYFWFLLLVSGFFFLLEILKPWREDQPRFRKDFWMDFFYMFFNFFLFSLVIYNAASDVFVNLFNNLLWTIGFHNLVAIEIQSWPVWAQLMTLFFVADFIQWNIHRLLHKVPFLWEFHKVHHSVEQMGFAAHLRYHWMENIVYKSIQYIPLAMIGFGISDFFLIYVFNIIIGHYNHSNIQVPKRIKGLFFGALLGGIIVAIVAESSFAFPAAAALYINLGIIAGMMGLGYGFLGGLVNYIFNSPEMHIWHHSWELPDDKPNGVNFGLTLSIWDYLFKTNWIPRDGRDIQLGFPGLKEFPTSFWGQLVFGFGKRKKTSEPTTPPSPEE